MNLSCWLCASRKRIEMNKNTKQIIRFGVVGGTAFLIDFGVLWFCTDVVGVNYLISNCIAFSVSVIYNYILSILWVFETKKKRDKLFEVLIFVFLSIIGLGINELIMWISVSKFGASHLFSKIVATALVMIYNFVSRKFFLEKGVKK